MAQETAVGDEREPGSSSEPVIEEVVVTGSRILRRDYFAPSPLVTMDRDAIEIAAQPTLEESLKRLPQVTPDAGRTTNNGGVGQSYVSLRYMGANRTLAMLNGRRLAPAGIGSSVDLNSLPQALIDRVEIITGGATTVYGSDAVAGVVNFKTRSDFDGFEAEVSAYVTGDGDSEVYDANLAWGHNFAERGNIALFGGYLERKATFTGEREFTSVQWGDVGIGRLVQLGSLAIPAGQITFPPVDLGNGPGPITFTPDGLPVEFVFPDDLYNFQPSNYLQVPLTRKYAGMFLDYDLSPRVELYVEITHTRNEGRTSIAPVPAILGPLAINLDNPVLEPETRQVFADNLFPAGNNTVLFEFWRRLEELGPRFSETHNDYSRLAAGLRGEINDRWSYDVWITVTRGEEEELLINNASASRLRQGLLVDPLTNNCFDTSNGCVPVDPFGIGRMSPDAADFLRLAPFSNLTSRDQQLVSGYVRGTPFDTWAGPASLVVGAEWRSDSGDFFADEGLSTGDVLGASGQASVDGTERVTEVYAELLLPLAEDRAFAKYLALEAGGRLSEYDHAGSLDTWKLGGVWEPFDEVRLRAMYQRSARAPNLLEAFEEQTVNRGAIVDGINGDPCSASEDPVANGNAEKCISQGIPADQIGVFEGTLFFPVDFLGGGNPGLVPETAESWTVGAVFGGDRSWTFSIDYFDMQIEDTIGNAAVGPVCFNPLNSDGALCDKVRRDAGNFNVFEIDGRILNLGDVRRRRRPGPEPGVDPHAQCPLPGQPGRRNPRVRRRIRQSLWQRRRRDVSEESTDRIGAVLFGSILSTTRLALDRGHGQRSFPLPGPGRCQLGSTHRVGGLEELPRPVTGLGVRRAFQGPPERRQRSRHRSADDGELRVLEQYRPRALRYLRPQFPTDTGLPAITAAATARRGRSRSPRAPGLLPGRAACPHRSVAGAQLPGLHAARQAARRIPGCHANSRSAASRSGRNSMIRSVRDSLRAGQPALSRCRREARAAWPQKRQDS
jgi:outer membrane receptor protein involved in Fe transport